MRRVKWLLAAALLLGAGPVSRAQVPGTRMDGWRGPGVPGAPTGGPFAPGALPPVPGARPGGAGLWGPSVGGPPTMRDIYGDLTGGGPGLPRRPTSVLGEPSVTIWGPGPGPAGSSAWPPAGMVPSVGSVPPTVPSLNIDPEVLRAVSGSVPPPPPPLPTFQPPLAAQPQAPPEWFQWWYALVLAGASVVAGLLYGLLRRKPAGG
jgi:hypothetical protein